MPAALKLQISSAGGAIYSNTKATQVIIENAVCVVLGARITNHGLAPHAAPTMVQASPDVFFADLPVCRVGDSASCGHAAANGATTTFIN